MTEQDAMLVLNATLGLGPVKIKSLINHYGSARNILANSSDQSTNAKLSSKPASENLAIFPKSAFLKKEYSLMDKHDIKFVVYTDEAYPKLLAHIDDAPLVLYYKGDIDSISPLSMAIVGSRRCSFYGMEMAHKFARQLADAGMCIVSGMARGIDTSAHKGALEHNGKTVAVLGCGLSHCYPPENEKLLNKICESGCVLSEFPMSVVPSAQNFPRRNRIISGLSLGVIVIEAFRRSGALITSRLATEQGREVFALPGNVDSPGAQGTNDLIKDGAKLIASVDDVLEEMSPQIQHFLHPKKEEESKPDQAVLNLSECEKTVYDLVKERPIHIDELASKSNLGFSRISAVILQLELRRLIQPLPGKLYTKRRQV